MLKICTVEANTEHPTCFFYKYFRSPTTLASKISKNKLENGNKKQFNRYIYAVKKREIHIGTHISIN